MAFMVWCAGLCRQSFAGVIAAQRGPPVHGPCGYRNAAKKGAPTRPVLSDLKQMNSGYHVDTHTSCQMSPAYPPFLL